MELKLSTWPEIKSYLESRKDIIIPIGSTEQHGPMGLIGTDAICPEIVAKGVAKKAGALMTPTLSMGMSQHHLSFPGTIALRPTTMIAVIKDLVFSLAGHGFTHIFFLNGHGGNISSVKTAFSEIYAEHSFSSAPSHLYLNLCNWYGGKRVSRLTDTHFKGAEGRHATPSEISLSFFAYPQAVKQAELKPEIAPDNSFTDRFDFAENFPDGRMGSDSSLASAKIGKELYTSAVKDVLETYHTFTGP